MVNALRALPSHEEEAPLSTDVIERITGVGPADAVSVAASLQESQRAVLAQFCYGRRHLRHLGLLIAGTLSNESLMKTFGGAWEVIYRQAQDPEKTMAAERRPASEQVKRTVTLAVLGEASFLYDEEQDDPLPDEADFEVVPHPASRTGSDLESQCADARRPETLETNRPA